LGKKRFQGVDHHRKSFIEAVGKSDLGTDFFVRTEVDFKFDQDFLVPGNIETEFAENIFESEIDGMDVFRRLRPDVDRETPERQFALDIRRQILKGKASFFEQVKIQILGKPIDIVSEAQARPTQKRKAVIELAQGKHLENLSLQIFHQDVFLLPRDIPFLGVFSEEVFIWKHNIR
jgi:hypothetical protein